MRIRLHILALPDEGTTHRGGSLLHTPLELVLAPECLMAGVWGEAGDVAEMCGWQRLPLTPHRTPRDFALYVHSYAPLV